jgi:type IV pilus assembly protein PilV
MTRGLGLLDAMIALTILSFGLLALTGLQSRTIARGTEAQSRLLASQFNDELLSRVLVDVANAHCYTLPQVGNCTSPGALASTTAWATTVAAALPPPVSISSTLDAATGQLSVLITWTTHARDGGSTDGDITRHQLAVTDARP